MRVELVGDVLGMAVARRGPGAGLLHHSDRGGQYAGDDYQHLLRSHGIQASMSGRGDCWDNAVMESFWATLKTELVNRGHRNVLGAEFATRQVRHGVLAV